MNPGLPAESLDRYETLRAHVINARPYQGLGWVLFMRYGMLTWCEMDRALPGVHQSLLTDVTGPILMMPESVGQAAIQVLAGMVLHLQHEVAYGL